MSTPPGGPSTINGVLYQMLWSLLRAGKVTVAAVECSDRDITGVTLVLEPRAGGDVRVQEDSIIVEQVKTRSDEGPWSLRQIVEGVLPDLYLAARSPAPGTRYSFVTDGHMGRWSSVAKFFQSLADREINTDAPLSCLDDTKAVPFQTSTKKSTAQAFWDDKPYTERRIVERIVEEVRKREKVRDEALAVTQSNVLKMLGALDFKWGQSASLLQNELDACLAAVVNQTERRSEICRSLAMALAQLATQGEAAIDPVAFFKSHGLCAVPLSNWVAIRKRATRVLDRELRLRRYDYQADVRAESADGIAKLWNSGTPLVVLSGETGFGKSWRLYALADRLRQSPALPLYIEARGNAEQTLGFAGQLFSEEVWGVDNPLSLARISERRKEFHPDPQWLTLIIDNVQSVDEAKQLGLKPWEDWGIRVAIGCHPSIAGVVEQSAEKRATAATVGMFSIEETHRFLEYSLPMGWSRIPQDVIEMLRRPLLAHLYVDAVADQSWTPVNEYELYDAHWRRIHQGSGSQHPLDEARLKALVRAFLDGKQYPWTDSQLLEAGVDDDAFDRLYRAGWMARSAEGQFAVPHDRLLNWAVAVTLVEDLEQERLDVTALGEKLRALSFGDATISGRYLGYSAMDVVWLVANNATLSGNLATLIPLLEVHHVQMEDLYTELLPTIGPPIVDSLFELLRQRSAMLYFQKQLIDGLCKLGGATVDTEVLKLLNSGIPCLQRYAFIFLAERPVASALPSLWKLHQDILADPAPWLEENDSKYLLRDECFAALRECCRLSPSWLADVAATADPALEPCSELAYLIANLPSDSGRATWQQAKSDLMKKVPKEKRRACCTFRMQRTSRGLWNACRILTTTLG